MKSHMERTHKVRCVVYYLDKPERSLEKATATTLDALIQRVLSGAGTAVSQQATSSQATSSQGSSDQRLSQTIGSKRSSRIFGPQRSSQVADPTSSSQMADRPRSSQTADPQSAASTLRILGPEPFSRGLWRGRPWFRQLFN